MTKSSKSKCWNMSKKRVFDSLIDFLLQGPRVYIYTLLKELQPDTIRIRIPNYTESVYKTMQIIKEITKLSPVTN